MEELLYITCMDRHSNSLVDLRDKEGNYFNSESAIPTGYKGSQHHYKQRVRKDLAYSKRLCKLLPRVQFTFKYSGYAHLINYKSNWKSYSSAVKEVKSSLKTGNVTDVTLSHVLLSAQGNYN